MGVGDVQPQQDQVGAVESPTGEYTTPSPPGGTGVKTVCSSSIFHMSFRV